VTNHAISGTVFLVVCHAISDISGTAFLLVHEHALILVLQDDHQQ
jgi:hypothetical protein